MDLFASMDEMERAFPLACTAEYRETVLGPGELIYIPRWCWHWIVAVDENAALQWRSANILPTVIAVDSDLDAVAAGTKRKFADGDTSPTTSHVRSTPGVTSRNMEDDGKISQLRSPHSFSISLWWGPRIEKPH